MKRSVIQLAGRTLLVSLPAKWVDANGVHKGDELDLLEDGHRLVINTEKSSDIETAELNADTIGQFIKRYIFAMYKKGIDEIKITYSDPKVVDAIRDTVLNQTVGYEIISQTPKSCIVKLITSGNIIDFDNLLRRIFLLSLSMSEEMYDSIKKGDFEHLSKTALLEKTNNRLTTICRRSLNKRGTDHYTKVGPIYYIVEELENLADEYKYFCNNLFELRDSKNTLKPEVLALVEKTNEALRIFYEMFYKFDIHKFGALDELKKKVDSEAQGLIKTKKLNPAELFAVHHSLVIIQRIFRMTGPQLVLIN